jgi:hypothetical protein
MNNKYQPGGFEVKFKMILILVAAVALVSFGLASTSYAYHNGGVAYCEGCHTMHNSANGAAVRTGNGLARYQAGPWLLQGPDASSACLNCHEGTPGSYHVSTTGVTPTSGTYPGNYAKAGGDFSWMRMTTNTTAAQNRGHNIVSLTYNYASDTVRTVAPGGTYDSTKLGCSGCHNPHGQTRRLSDGSYTNGGAPITESGSHGEVPGAGEAVGAYRILGGAGYTPVAFPSVTFTANPPYAAAVSYGDGDKVAYGTGMSEWCGNCHGGIYENAFVSGTAGHRHPASSTTNAALTAAIVTNYNTYLGSGITGGAPATAKYNRLVPTEEGSTDVATLETHAASTNNTAVSTSNNVMCLSCHRAHASGFLNMGRFSFTNELVTDETGGFEAVDGISDTTYIARAYNGNTFGVAQRMLCNKCHAKD